MSRQRTAHIIADLGYGDSGKGTITDFLTRTHLVHTVVRANGGAQAGHGVVTPDGKRHTFSQFGSGMFVRGVRTHLSRHFILAPTTMLAEERHLAALGVHDAFARTDISAEALVITPFHRSVNRLRELLRGPAVHGSVGIGIGETAAHAERAPDEALRVGDLRDPARLRPKLLRIQESMYAHIRPRIDEKYATGDITVVVGDTFLDEMHLLRDARVADLWMEQLKPFIDVANIVDETYLAALCAKPGDIVFESAQGVLLDERWGFFPHCTRSNCTFENPLGLLKDMRYDGTVIRIGIMRSYATRHGAGPFVTEDPSLDEYLPEPQGDDGSWAGHFRVGWPDLVSARYALEACNGADMLAVTCLDRIRALPDWKVCTAYNASGLSREQRRRNFGKGGRILLGQRDDLKNQAAITAALRDIRPVYDDVGLSDADGRRSLLLARIQDMLGVPIGIVSHGPTANDKIII